MLGGMLLPCAYSVVAVATPCLEHSTPAEIKSVALIYFYASVVIARRASPPTLSLATTAYDVLGRSISLYCASAGALLTPARTRAVATCLSWCLIQPQLS